MSQNARVALWVPTGTPADVEAVISTQGPAVDGVLPTEFEAKGTESVGPPGPQGPQGMPGVPGPQGPPGPQGIVEDAPEDGIIYGRADTRWVPVAVEDAAVPSDTLPLMDGTAAAGAAAAYARGDHKHPSDTAKVDTTAMTAALALKANLASPPLTGTPTAPTAAVNNNSTQLATTAYVDRAATAAGETPSNDLPLMNGIAAAGSSDFYARGDHKHPSDTAKADVSHGHAQSDITNLGTDLTARVLKAGDTMTGALVLPADPTTNLQAATKQYVDTKAGAATDSTKVLKTGDTMTGDLIIQKVNPLLALDCTDVTQAVRLRGRKLGVERWQIQLGDGAAETGSNQGSNFALYRYNDVGTLIDSVFSVGRADGNVAGASLATAAEYRSNSAARKLLTQNAVWEAALGVTLTDVAGVYTPDFSAGIDFAISLFGAKTIANPINTKNGQKGIIVIAAGNSAAALTWGTAYKFPGGVKPTISIVPISYDIISYYVYSSNTIFCTFAADFK